MDRKLYDDVVRNLRNLEIAIEALGDEPLEKPFGDSEIFARFGDKSARVNLLQSELNRFFKKRVLKEDGDYGENTQKQVDSVYKLYGALPQRYVTFGIVDYIYASNATRDTSVDSLQEVFFREVLLSEARRWARLNEKEGVNTKVWVEFQEEWAAYAGYSRTNWAWCAVYVHELLDKSGLNMPYYYLGSTLALVGNWKKWAVAEGFWTQNPKAGDICLWNGYSHIGFVTDYSNGVVTTSEGNSNNMTRSRKVDKDKFAGFISIPDGYTFWKK